MALSRGALRSWSDLDNYFIQIVISWLSREVRRAAFEANNEHDPRRAKALFDAAYALDKLPSSLLSAANMRLKCGDAAIAREIYVHLIRSSADEGVKLDIVEKAPFLASPPHAPIPAACSPARHC